uniref:Cellulase 5 n=1 Tax=Mesosa myops TaxID=993118 RepID=A0A0X9ZQA8_9CUCU|nr:cellulase 5 [Mesosa myops]
MKLIICISLALLALLVDAKDAAKETVSKHGQLSVKGANLVNKNGEIVQLKGMALYWSQWMPQYWNKDTIDGIHDSCHSNVVRASMAVDDGQGGGYLFDPDTQMQRVETVIEAAIADDLYIIVDWHEEKADTHQAQAVDFFSKISKKYGKHPNILYETFNEPTDQSWSSTLKPYHEAVIKAIRANDPNNIIIVGTAQWSQRVDEPADDPIKGTNIMYTLHFYAGTHKQWLRDLAQGAIDKGLPIFVTEYGTDNVDVVNQVDEEESKLWWAWLDKNNLSYTNWAICDANEASAALIANTPANKVCQADYLTLSGKLVVEQNKK